MKEFDEIVNIEQMYHCKYLINHRVINQATIEAWKDAKILGLDEGRELGFIRGYVYSKEIFFYSEICQYFIDSHNTELSEK